MKGYWHRPEETAEAIRDGWFHTGDLARVDSDGYFYIVDRKKDLIIRGGYNVYPREIEEVLYEHPAVAEAAVIGAAAACVIVLLLVPLAKEMGKKQTTQPPAAQHPTGNQLTDDLLVVYAALSRSFPFVQ